MHLSLFCVCCSNLASLCLHALHTSLSLSFLLCNLSVRNVELFYPFLLCVFEGSNLNTVFFFLAEPICFLCCTEYYGSFSQYGKAEYCSISLLTFESPVAFFFLFALRRSISLLPFFFTHVPLLTAVRIVYVYIELQKGHGSFPVFFFRLFFFSYCADCCFPPCSRTELKKKKK